MIKALLMDIFEQALIINNQGQYQVFAYLSPHVSSISVRIFKGDWKNGDNSIRDIDCYYDNVNSVRLLSEMNLMLRDYKEAE